MPEALATDYAGSAKARGAKVTAKPASWLAGILENDGITRRCLEKDGCIENPG